MAAAYVFPGREVWGGPARVMSFCLFVWSVSVRPHFELHFELRPEVELEVELEVAPEVEPPPTPIVLTAGLRSVA